MMLRKTQPEVETIVDDLTRLYRRFQDAYTADMRASGSVSVVVSCRKILQFAYPDPYPFWRREVDMDVFDVSCVHERDMPGIPDSDKIVVKDLCDLQRLLPYGVKLLVKRHRGAGSRDILVIEWIREGN